MRRKLLTALISLALLLIPQTDALAAKKKSIPNPSPRAIWPPEGFRENDGVYAKIPSSRELVGLLSARRSLQKYLKDCEKFACGAVFVAAETGCQWWEINSSVRRIDPVTQARERIGSLITYAKGTKDRQLTTVILVSSEPVDVSISVGGIKVICHREPGVKPDPGNIYNPIPSKVT